MTTKAKAKKGQQMNNTKIWLNNPDQVKTPKIFQVTMMRDKEGFHLIDGESKYLQRKNQHSNSWVNVDTQELALVLRTSKIICK